MRCAKCGCELASEKINCRFCEALESGNAESLKPHERPMLRITIGPEEGVSPSGNAEGEAEPTKSAECPDCGHTVFKVIGPKFDEPHEHNMLVVECCGCGFQGRMRWQGVARTTLTIKAPIPPDPRISNAARQ